jgi:hypothetical protein
MSAMVLSTPSHYGVTTGITAGMSGGETGVAAGMPPPFKLPPATIRDKDAVPPFDLDRKGVQTLSDYPVDSNPPQGFRQIMRYSDRLMKHIPASMHSSSQSADRFEDDDNTTEDGDDYVPLTPEQNPVQSQEEEQEEQQEEEQEEEQAASQESAYSDVSGASHLSATELYNKRNAKFIAKYGPPWQDPDAWRYQDSDSDDEEEAFEAKRRRVWVPETPPSESHTQPLSSDLQEGPVVPETPL